MIGGAVNNEGPTLLFMPGLLARSSAGTMRRQDVRSSRHFPMLTAGAVSGANVAALAVAAKTANS